jgi:hypothetical protein
MPAQIIFVLPQMQFLDLLVSGPGLIGIGLWAIALYLGLASWQQSIAQTLEDWLLPNDHGSSGSIKAPQQWLVQGSLVCLSTLPFLGLGTACATLCIVTLGQSWSISLALMACIWLGIYELGRQNQTL